MTDVVLLTPSGRSAVASVCVDGPSAMATVDGLFLHARHKSLAEQPVGSLLFGCWEVVGGEEVVVVRTGDARVEVHCHGGLAASRAIVASLCATGCRERAWSDWVGNEALVQLAQARTPRTAEILLDQYQGSFERTIAEIRQQIERGESEAVLRRVERLESLSPVGLHLVAPWRVCLAGVPNVGKSSLINRLVGFERALTFDEPGTTRDALRVDTAFDGWPVRLSDTAGIRPAHDPIEAAGIDRAREEIERADLVVWVVDASDPNSMQRDLPEGIEGRVLRVANKADLVEGELAEGFLPTSATTGSGIDALCAAIVARLVRVVPQPGEAVPISTEQVRSLAAYSRGS